MKITTNTVLDILSRWRTFFSRNNAFRNYGDEEPLRSELYSLDQLVRHGTVLAAAHELLPRKCSDQLLKRLDDNEHILKEVRNMLVESLGSEKTVTPAAEWLLDNFYLIEEQILIARRHLPKGYSEGLPCLASGNSAGLPRVYDIALEIISHSDGRVDMESLDSFVAAYQTYAELTLGELWAIPIMLRLAVIENLRRVAGKIALDRIDDNLAGYWAEKMTTIAREDPANLILCIADMARSGPVLDSPFVAAFTRKLQGKGPALALSLTWMEQQLSAEGNSSTELVRQENQKQAADQVSIRNSIGTLRVISATDWRDFVESLSAVEQVLREDPAGAYPRMNFATRDRYRHAVESIAKKSALSEKEVAIKALELSGRGGQAANPVVPEESTKRQEHIGYFLVDKGRRQTERSAQVHYSPGRRLLQFFGRRPLTIYLLSIFVLTVVPAAGMWYIAYRFGVHHHWLLWLTALLSLGGSAQLAVALVNWISTLLVKPELMPSMDFSRGIPAGYRTFVAIPTLLTAAADIESLLEDLEIRFLANRDANLHFGLLTDLPDADEEVLPDDGNRLRQVRAGILKLNERYSPGRNDLFFLFHRPRTWNPQEKKWMGYERKRGKLAALNAFLRSAGKNEFSVIEGETSVLAGVKYVITLDTDTVLPGEAARRMIEAMAHPLNHAFYNVHKKRVTEGYGILQPRLATAMPKTAPTPYLRMQDDVTGIDPYTRASSDVYQDLFGEGSFIGKGIYDVDVFEQATREVFPENRILSHDLLEGCYARCGLLSDVNLYEENPSLYLADIRRRHRWIRGDWQAGAWMLPFVPNGRGRLTKNNLSVLSRWKLFDNLRRSLLPATLFLLLLFGWTVLPYAWFWTLAISAVLLLPSLLSAAWQLLNKPPYLDYRSHLAEVGVVIRDTLFRFLFAWTVLPFEALVYMNAIFRTNWRMIFSHKRLLQWSSSAAVSRGIRNAIGPVSGVLWMCPLTALAVAGYLGFEHSPVLSTMIPVLAAWLMAPVIVWRLGVPVKGRMERLQPDQEQFLHIAARKTWSYFEAFITADENWLPPDNYQEQPVTAIAHRTSPTNMGLSLLSALAAADFGYIAGGELLDRCSRTLKSMAGLQRYQGHFFNWYDTRSAQPLPPRYVSAVDSGNLMGHLLTLRQGFLALPDKPAVSGRLFEGLHTTACVLVDQPGGPTFVKAKELEEVFAPPDDGQHLVSLVVKRLDRIESQTRVWLSAIDGVKPIVSEPGGNGAALAVWANKLLAQIKSHREDIARLYPWLDLLPVPARFDRLSVLDSMLSVRDLQRMPDTLLPVLDELDRLDNPPEERSWLISVRKLVIDGSAAAAERVRFSLELADQCEALSDAAYDFLLDRATGLLHIGYNVDEQRKDAGFYDLLASEMRLGIFAGIALGKLPRESWFSPGRLLVRAGGKPILLSWSGSMFEYLMPQLVMPSHENTLLAQTNAGAVKRQMEYAHQHGVPWGISEAAYNMVDAGLNYQYRAFGIPGLGLKRGLKDDLVIAPYAAMLALMVEPAKACANLQRLTTMGAEGQYGYYESIDFTPGRLPKGKRKAVIQCFMVHHQGMSLLSLACLLLDKPMQRRFLSDLRFQATDLLLQEREPRTALLYAHTTDLAETHTATGEMPVRRIATANTPVPAVQLLGNGRYQVMITNSGGGYSRWKDLAVTRWREDTTRDNHGIFCYIKDLSNGVFWSNTWQPTLHGAKEYESLFSQGHVEFRRQDQGIHTRTEIVISSEDDTEMRKVSITNKTASIKILEITSYAEVVLASQASDESHPAFGNLFVETEIRPEEKAILCTRRPRSREEAPPWLFHLMQAHDTTVDGVSYETSRMAFTGRGKDLAHPRAMGLDRLSGSQGPVLDPILSIRYRIRVNPGKTAVIDLVYGIAETKETCERLLHKYRDPYLKNRALELSWTHSQVLLRQINASESDAQLYNRLAAYIIYPDRAFRAAATTLYSNLRGQSGLWGHSVSGDLPIVLLHVYDPDNLDLVKQLIRAHAYWRLQGLPVDLVIWNEDYGSYRQALQERIQGLISSEAVAGATYSKPGAIFVRAADQLSTEDRILFESVARLVLHDNQGTLHEQMERTHAGKIMPPLLETKVSSARVLPEPESHSEQLSFFNGTGGFSADGREYRMTTDSKRTTPAPWVNVLANPGFGTVVSESGSAYTWAVNAHEYRLTPWSNDPVSDGGEEAFYIRNEETGSFWSPAAHPVRGATDYRTTHGFGYSIFNHTENGIASEFTIFVDKSLPVKFFLLKMRNVSGGERRLTVTGYLGIVLGDLRSKTNMHVLSEQGQDGSGLSFRNRYNTPFADRVTFFKTNGAMLSFTADRREFIGRNRTLEAPEAMYRKSLSGTSGAGMDPCAAIQVRCDLLDKEEKEIIFQLGSGESQQAVLELIRQFSTPAGVYASLAQVKDYWNGLLSTILVTTPDAALNIMANGWLLYQTVACRLFARSGFYQSGGAFGFRDQLQDVLALLPVRPSMARDQLLLNASRQFAEGDVQHWWHPPEGRGVRTRCSDDLLWLPYAVARYIDVTGDTDILKETEGFLESRTLQPHEDSVYDLPASGSLHGTLYEHCKRAIQHAMRFGEHGLPLIGSGDWNDGMDKVGSQGRGESVWLAFFFYDVLIRFSAVAVQSGDTVFADTCRTVAGLLRSDIDASAWDGQWWLRAWFDNGTPLGSAQNEECQIDAIAQSWGILSGVSDDSRARMSMASLDKYLVSRPLKLIRLLTPAFNTSDLNPGYIMGYLPGVRENGGQYTHAAVWALMAFAELCDREKVWELFSMMLPLNHSSDPASADIYKVEPYVMAGDVYAGAGNEGRGGWTWYTGSAGWTYQFVMGSLLGMRLNSGRLTFRPCFPSDWPSVSVIYRYGAASYAITIYQEHQTGKSWWIVDGKRGEGAAIDLETGEGQHHAEVHVFEQSAVRMGQADQLIRSDSIGH
ncbi:MAG TPA: glucoamylase family protein [Puia sp.]|nr:glucoamylase family protein [Puia sp.]